MPHCNNCGNTTEFIHHFIGTEARIYNAEGELEETERLSDHTKELECAECESFNVTVE